MVTITRTKSVLIRSKLEYTVAANHIPFEQIDEDTGLVTRTLIMTRRDVDDLGWPDEITITIEPGDKLNEET